MYIILEIKGFQYKVSEGDEISVNFIKLKKNSGFFINKILFYKNKNLNYYFYNRLYLKKIFLFCRIIKHYKKKIKILKFKKRKNIKKFKGYNMKYTKIYIEKINFDFKF